MDGRTMAANFALRAAIALCVVSGASSFTIEPHFNFLGKRRFIEATRSLRIGAQGAVKWADMNGVNRIVRMSHRNCVCSQPGGLQHLRHDFCGSRNAHLFFAEFGGRTISRHRRQSCGLQRNKLAVSSQRSDDIGYDANVESQPDLQSDIGSASTSADCGEVKPISTPASRFGLQHRRAVMLTTAAAAIAAMTSVLPAAGTSAAPAAPAPAPLPAPPELALPDTVEIPLQKCGPAYCVTYRCACQPYRSMG
jgi:hypothetical protein